MMKSKHLMIICSHIKKRAEDGYTLHEVVAVSPLSIDIEDVILKCHYDRSRFDVQLLLSTNEKEGAIRYVFKTKRYEVIK